MKEKIKNDLFRMVTLLMGYLFLLVFAKYSFIEEGLFTDKQYALMVMVIVMIEYILFDLEEPQKYDSILEALKEEKAIKYFSVSIFLVILLFAFLFSFVFSISFLTILSFVLNMYLVLTFSRIYYKTSNI